MLVCSRSATGSDGLGYSGRAAYICEFAFDHDLEASSDVLIGRLLIRLPVAAKMALHTAGAIGGVAGSPTPPCPSVLGTM